MTKVRINDLARELEVKSKPILDALEAIGVSGKTHSSSIEPDQAERVREYFKNGGTDPSGRAAASKAVPAFNLSKVSKPGDALKAILERRNAEAAARNAPPQRGPVVVAAPTGVSAAPGRRRHASLCCRLNRPVLGCHHSGCRAPGTAPHRASAAPGCQYHCADASACSRHRQLVRLPLLWLYLALLPLYLVLAVAGITAQPVASRPTVVTVTPPVPVPPAAVAAAPSAPVVAPPTAATRGDRSSRLPLRLRNLLRPQPRLLRKPPAPEAAAPEVSSATARTRSSGGGRCTGSAPRSGTAAGHHAADRTTAYLYRTRAGSRSSAAQPSYLRAPTSRPEQRARRCRQLPASRPEQRPHGRPWHGCRCTPSHAPDPSRFRRRPWRSTSSWLHSRRSSWPSRLPAASRLRCASWRCTRCCSRR